MYNQISGGRFQNGRLRGNHRPHGPGRGRRGGGLRAKIQQGLQNGTITKEEAQSIRAQRQKMHQLKQSVMADGQVSPQEHKQLKSYRRQMGSIVNSFLKN